MEKKFETDNWTIRKGLGRKKRVSIFESRPALRKIYQSILKDYVWIDFYENTNYKDFLKTEKFNTHFTIYSLVLHNCESKEMLKILKETEDKNPTALVVHNMKDYHFEEIYTYTVNNENTEVKKYDNIFDFGDQILSAVGINIPGQLSETNIPPAIQFHLKYKNKILEGLRKNGYKGTSIYIT